MSDPVADGRDALNHWFGYPWYDAKTDGVRRVEVSQPWNVDWRLDRSLRSSSASLLQWAGLDRRSRCCWPAWRICWSGAYLQRERGRGETRRRAGRARPTASNRCRCPSPPRRGDLLAEARRCYEHGDYGQAIVYLFSHQLVQLDKHQMHPPGPRKDQSAVLCARSARGRRCAGWSSRRCWPSRRSFSAITRSIAPRSRPAGRGWTSSRRWWRRAEWKWRADSSGQ